MAGDRVLASRDAAMLHGQVEALLPMLDAVMREAGLAGAKVTRGVAGYGRSRHIHESWRGFSYDLPVVIEIIDSEEKIDAFLPALQRVRQGALVTRQRLEILSPDDGGATR